MTVSLTVVYRNSQLRRKEGVFCFRQIEWQVSREKPCVLCFGKMTRHSQQRGRKVGKAEAKQAGMSANYGGKYLHNSERKCLLKFCTFSVLLCSPPHWPWLRVRVGRTSLKS